MRGQETKARNKFNWKKTVPPKGVRLWKLERGPRNIKQANKRYQNKGRHTKWILRIALE